MALTTGTYVLGQHVKFARKGDAFTVPGNGTVDREAKPGATDPAAWLDLGELKDADDSPPEDEVIEIHRAVPGRIVHYDNIRTKTKQSGKFKTDELTPLAIQALYRTGNLGAASTQFNRLEGVQLKGWLKRQIYSQTDAAVVVEDVFVELSIDGDVKTHGGLCEVNWKYQVLHSTLNTGTL